MDITIILTNFDNSLTQNKTNHRWSYFIIKNNKLHPPKEPSPHMATLLSKTTYIIMITHN